MVSTLLLQIGITTRLVLWNMAHRSLQNFRNITLEVKQRASKRREEKEREEKRRKKRSLLSNLKALGWWTGMTWSRPWDAWYHSDLDNMSRIATWNKKHKTRTWSWRYNKRLHSNGVTRYKWAAGLSSLTWYCSSSDLYQIYSKTGLKKRARRIRRLALDPWLGQRSVPHLYGPDYSIDKPSSSTQRCVACYVTPGPIQGH